MDSPRKDGWWVRKSASTILNGQSDKGRHGTQETPETTEEQGIGAEYNAPRAPYPPEGDQIKALIGNRWDVASQGTKGVLYRVSFAGEGHICGCAYHTTGKGCRRKHIAAVEHALLISPEAALGKKIDIREQVLACPDCGTKYSSDVWYHGRHEKRHGYKCVICKRRFGDNLGFEYRQVSRLYIMLTLMLSGMGMTAANIRMTLKHLGMGARGHHNQYPGAPSRGGGGACQDPQAAVHGGQVGLQREDAEGPRQGVVYGRCHGPLHPVHPGVGHNPPKEKHDAVPLLRTARDMAGGMIPRLFITNGLDQYHIAFKKVFRTLRGLRPIHIRDIHIRNLIYNTNKQERLNEGFAGRFRHIPAA